MDCTHSASQQSCYHHLATQYSVKSITAHVQCHQIKMYSNCILWGLYCHILQQTALNSWEDWKQQLAWRERILILKAKNPAMTKQQKNLNQHKSARHSGWVSEFLKGSQWCLNQSMAGSPSPIVQSFALFTCHTPAAGTGSEPFPAAAKQPRNGTKS